MLWVIAILMITGLTILIIGVFKAVKSKFTDLNVLLWVFIGYCVYHMGLGIMGVVL